MSCFLASQITPPWPWKLAKRSRRMTRALCNAMRATTFNPLYRNMCQERQWSLLSNGISLNLQKDDSSQKPQPVRAKECSTPAVATRVNASTARFSINNTERKRKSTNYCIRLSLSKRFLSLGTMCFRRRLHYNLIDTSHLIPSNGLNAWQDSIAIVMIPDTTMKR